MPYENPIVHKVPNNLAGNEKTLRSPQPRLPLNRILAIVGVVGFIAVIIASYYWL
jgi:hypothetical protein